jgi:hypothetical protein
MLAVRTSFLLLIGLFSQKILHAKIVDLSRFSDPGGTYEIGFCARESPDAKLQLPGHAFVSFSHRPIQGNRSFLALGHTIGPGTGTTGAAWSYFGAPVAGIIKEENYTSRMQHCLVVKVDKKDYDGAMALTKSPLVKLGLDASNAMLQNYKLGAEDCISFTREVASHLKRSGLKIPERQPSDVPQKFIAKLIEQN